MLVLFAYPVAAAAENWLHDCLTDALRQSMESIDAARDVVDWPECLPEPCRDPLRRFTAVATLVRELLNIYTLLSGAERAAVRQAMDDQSALPELFDGQRLAAIITSLPEAARGPSRRLFEKAFEMLTTLGIRDRNYRNFIGALPHRVCAFCGCEYFSGPSSKREPLDHYLAISLYPFAGANARNLVPMGSRCNSSYKLSQDVLRDHAGERRVCFDPYSCAPVTVNLMETRLFARADGLPEWHVNLAGDVARIATWDDVFQVRARYINDHLDSIYKNSLKVFRTLWQRESVVLGERADVCQAFVHLADLSRQKGWSDRAFLETALYELLYERCAAGGEEAERLKAEFAG